MSDPSLISNELPEPSLATSITSMVEFRLADVHTAMPGKVLAFDPLTNSCDVQPQLKRVFQTSDGTLEEEPAPRVNAVPVLWPRGGGFRITWPLAVNDIVLLVFVERSIDQWSQLGGELVPNSTRKHDWSDAIAVPGLAPVVTAIKDVGVTDLVIGREDGLQEVRITPTGVVVKGTSVALGATGGPPVGRVGDMVTIDPSTAPDFYAAIAAIAAGLTMPQPPFTSPITGKISSGSAKVTST